MLRTRLRRLNADDFHNMRELESNAQIMRFTSMLVPQSEDQTRVRLARNMADPGVWAAELNDGSFVGWFMLKPTPFGEFEIGFMIVPSMERQGLTTEVAGHLVEMARAQDPSARIMARTRIDNIASMRVLEKIGFRFSEKVESHANVYRLP